MKLSGIGFGVLVGVVSLGMSVCAAENADSSAAEVSADFPEAETVDNVVSESEDTDSVAVEEIYADETAAQDFVMEVSEYHAVLYSNRKTALYETADLASDIVLTAAQFPNEVPVTVVGITSSGFYQVDVGGIYYIPATGLDEEVPSLEAVDISGLEPGLQELAGGLVYVQEDGTLLTDGYYEYLYFGEDGYYTSGNEELDELVEEALAVCTDDSMTQSEKLRAAYVYVRDNFTYLSRDHHSRGVNDWTEESAVFMFTNGKGNCYCFAGAFLYLARRIGYSSAYPVSGGVGTTNADHAWVMITMEDGVEYMFDVELEYAYLYRYANKHAYNLYQMTTATAPWRYYFP